MPRRDANTESFTFKRSYGNSLPVKYVLSCCAATVAEAGTYPLDLTKTRLQLCGVGGAAAVEKRGMVKTAFYVAKDEGVLKLWQGLTPALYRHVVYTGVRMAVYETMRDIKRDDPLKPLPVWRAVVQGGIAGGFAQFLASPTDLVKVQMQMEGRRRLEGLPPRLHSAGHAFKVLLKEAGFRGLWRGCIPNVQRAMMVNMGDLATYDSAKRHIINSTTFFEDNMLTHALASCMSGFVASCLGTPADVVKTRVMNQPLDSRGRGLHYRGSIDCLIKTISEEGFLALYRGFIPTWVRLAPWSLTFWLTYEQLRRLSGAGGF